MAIAGSLIGCVIGALLTWAVSRIPIRVRGLIYANHFLVAWDWRHYFWAARARDRGSPHRKLRPGPPRGLAFSGGHASRIQRLGGFRR